MTQTLSLKLLPGEHWWGGVIHDGTAMPFGRAYYRRDLGKNLAGNQGQPLLLSSSGRFVWSEEPFWFEFSDGTLRVAGDGAVEQGEGHGDLGGAYRYVSQTFFPPTGTYPDLRLFTAPQYNTWIELQYDQTQEGVLLYAEGILAAGLPPGVLMIDDNWQEDYGSWVFHPARFPDPAAMVQRLHEMGFAVMLWTCPHVSPDSVLFRWLRMKGYLLREAGGDVAIRKWWNGYSAILDCTNDDAVAWYHAQLDMLMTEYGVDGFKLDAGDPEFYRADDLCARPTHPAGHCEAWGRVGLRYSLNEYRACWKLAGQPLVQRLRDKNHAWGADGLATLIPNGLAQGLVGYAFNCPDMIGGGEVNSFNASLGRLDQELVVRFAQCSALFPMMQFSAAPWRVLDAEHLAHCVDAARLHAALGEEIAEMARRAAVTGEPIMRHLAYQYPDGGYETVTDQFLLGEGILVAPVLVKGARSRTVLFPPGTWQGDDGSMVEGPCTLTVDAPLARLPWYRLVGNR